MKYFLIIIVYLFFVSCSVFSQDKIIKHTVSDGETIDQIAKKYKVTPFDIYQLNPDARAGLKPYSVLLISKSFDKKASVSQNATNGQAQMHEVIAKETLYGIEKKYGVSDEDLKKANPSIEKDGLQIGQVLVIPSKKNINKNSVTQDIIIYHDVLPKETKYSIAKQYGITIEELEKRNPEVVTNLPIGYKLIIKGKVSNGIKIVEHVESNNKVVSPIDENTVVEIKYVDYEVKPKETLYSLSKMFNISQEELILLNPALNDGVDIGMILKVPTEVPVLKEVKKEYVALSKSIADGKRKKLVFLLPFNISRIEGDTINSTSERLKKDKFLNMTLDFYSGALMAIDSAKVLGFPIDVEIYDSGETKNSSNVASIIRKNKLETANAIIGPFYQSNAETVAQMLSENNVPVISPLSKDVGNPFSNLYQTIPTNEAIKNTMFDYMRANNGNIIAVVDKKKESIVQYLQEFQKDVPFAEFKENGGLSTESLKSMLVKDRMNYVVMETGNTWMIKTTISSMLSSMSTYQVQLVILETNETLDTDEINFLNLTKLKLMYPSVIRDNESPEAVIFEKEYRKINNIFPSVFATRGFDVTFDTMMRLVQNKKFEEMVNSVATKRVDNKFEYYRKKDGGYTNKGVFILYYDTDLTIKEAN